MTAPTPEPIVEPVVDPAEEPAVEPVVEPVVEPAEEPAGDELDLDGAKAALAKVRKSEAAMRVRLREAEAKLADAKTPEEVEALRQELSETNAAEARALVVENVALKFGLPDDLAARLKGSTREELEADAKELAKYAPSPEGGNDPDLGGGLDPSTDPDGGYDPQKRARELRAARRGF